MSKLEEKSQISQCENIRRIYQEHERKISRKNDKLARGNFAKTIVDQRCSKSIADRSAKRSYTSKTKTGGENQSHE